MKTRIQMVAFLAAAVMGFACGDKDKKKAATDDGAGAETAGEAADKEVATPEPAPPRPRNLSAQETLTAAQACWQAAAASEAEALAGCYAEGAVVEAVDAVPGEAGGAVLAGLRAELTDMTMEPQLTIVNGNTVAAVLLVKGTVGDGLWGLPAKGKKVSFYVGQMAQAGGEETDGQIDPVLVRDLRYLDQSTLLSQIGAERRSGAPSKAEALPEAREAIADPTQKMTESFAAFNKGYMAAGQKGDVAMMGAAYAENATVRYVPEAKALEGQKAIAAWLGKLGDGFKLSMRRQWGAGDWIVAETLADGKLGEQAWQLKRLELVRYADGKIAEHWIFANELDRAVDLGTFDPATLTVEAAGATGGEPADEAAAPQ